ncbi:peptidoglycan-binding protein [Micromonospora saelicesensis]|uniref:peptidoglycan-binding protein n=1 Tax=Micromonospora saelicesensis TaxID=285676 RepID=UPI003D8A7F43
MPVLHRQKRLLQLLVVVALVVTVSALLAAGWIRSPQERMAETAAPGLTMLTAAVEQRVLKETVVMRGQVGAATTVEVTPAPRGEGRAVMTGVRVRPGDEFGAGSVLLEIAGRPLIAMPGAVPAYRDLRPGSKGKDVVQLQRALASLGHRSSDRSGEFGQGTKAALVEFYERIGYDVATTGDDDAKELAAAAVAVRAAERTRSEAVELRDRLRRADRSGATVNADAMREAERAVRYAEEDLTQTKVARAELESRSGAILPMSEVVFLSSFPARMEKLTGSVGQEVKAPLVTLSAGALIVRAKLNPAQRKLVDADMPVTVSSELTGESYPGRVATIGELRQDDGGARSHELTVRTSQRLSAKLAGADMRLTIEAASTKEEVLVVPVSALYASADGQVAVQRQLLDGGSQRIPVVPGMTGNGYVAVQSTDGTLKSGDQVSVGRAAP